jgi:hypothetical protein
MRSLRATTICPFNSVLKSVRPGLEAIGYKVEIGKRSDERIKVPVLFGRNGSLEKYFDADRREC